MKRLFQLDCTVKHYEWGGCCGHHSGQKPFIADLLGLPASAGEHFAELWIGAHPEAPSQVILAAQKKKGLDALIEKDPLYWLGPGLLARGMDKLPFLLKIIDSARPLSIQAHPDRQLAARLHRKDPESYPDDNHKPEIAIALGTGLEALCGFRPVADIMADLRDRPPLAEFINPAGLRGEGLQWLRNAYRCLYTISRAELHVLLGGLHDFLRGWGKNSQYDECFLRLLKIHPGDPGCLSAYFLNLQSLSADQALLIDTGQPHAYLHGTLIECMASSDNVVRAGLTSKPIDWRTFIQMLDYRSNGASVTGGFEKIAGERIYRGAAVEFQVEILTFTAGIVRDYQSEGEISLLLVLDGTVEFATEDWRETAARGTAWVWPGAIDQVRMTFLQDNSKVVLARPCAKRYRTHASVYMGRCPQGSRSFG